VAKPGLTATDLVSALHKEGVRMLAAGPRTIRAVTHYEVTAKDIEYALKIISQIIK
jgi:threonine aldolase